MDEARSATVIARSSIAGLRVGQRGVVALTRQTRALIANGHLEPYDAGAPDPELAEAGDDGAT